MQRENPLERDRFVKVMADFSSYGIWCKDGCMADLDDLTVDHQTIFELGIWQHWHDARKHDEPIPSIEKFRYYGWRIVDHISRQKPHWTVVYADPIDHQYLIKVRLWLKSPRSR